MYLFNLLNVFVQAPAQVAQSVVSDFLTSPLTSGSPTLDANLILDNLITSIREDMKQRCAGSCDGIFTICGSLYIINGSLSPPF